MNRRARRPRGDAFVRERCSSRRDIELDALALDEALDALSAIDSRQCLVVALRRRSVTEEMVPVRGYAKGWNVEFEGVAA